MATTTTKKIKWKKVVINFPIEVHNYFLYRLAVVVSLCRIRHSSTDVCIFNITIDCCCVDNGVSPTITAVSECVCADATRIPLNTIECWKLIVTKAKSTVNKNRMRRERTDEEKSRGMETDSGPRRIRERSDTSIWAAARNIIIIL